MSKHGNTSFSQCPLRDFRCWLRQAQCCCPCDGLHPSHHERRCVPAIPAVPRLVSIPVQLFRVVCFQVCITVYKVCTPLNAGFLTSLIKACHFGPGKQELIKTICVAATFTKMHVDNKKCMSIVLWLVHLTVMRLDYHAPNVILCKALVICDVYPQTSRLNAWV